MTQENRNFGTAAEELSLRELKRRGYVLLEKNYRSRLGEIDIIAKDKGMICFIEVKARRSDFKGTPFEAVTPAKQKKLSQLAVMYLKKKNWLKQPARFDVVAVTRDHESNLKVDILKNAFGLHKSCFY